MALAQCRECGKEVSTHANTCPHCGIKRPAGRSNATRAAAIIGLLVVAIFVAGKLQDQDHVEDIDRTTSVAPTESPVSYTPEQAAPAPKDSAPINVSVEQLFQDYQANEVSADLKYKGKVLAVTGNVQSIDKTFDDEISVKLKTSNEFEPVLLTGISESDALHLHKGDNITATCIGAGMVLGSPDLRCKR